MFEDCELMLGDLGSDINDLERKLVYEVDTVFVEIHFIFNARGEKLIEKSGVLAY